MLVHGHPIQIVRSVDPFEIEKKYKRIRQEIGKLELILAKHDSKDAKDCLRRLKAKERRIRETYY